MRRRPTLVGIGLLTLAVWPGCWDQPKVAPEQGAIVIQPEAEKVIVIESAEELKRVNAKKIIWKKDGAKMVSVKSEVPARYEEKKTFDRRGNSITKKISDGSPSLWMDTTEVTVGQFKKFLSQTDHQFDGDLWSSVETYSPTDKHPMINVSWNDAMAYTKWAGKRLPMDREWGFAAKGSLVGKKFSWGEDDRVARDYANYAGIGGKDKWEESTAPVGSFKPNGYGLYDMAGNVWEWCQDWYTSDKFFRVLRGGSWNLNATNLRVARRYFHAPHGRLNYFGFRCVSGFDKP